MGVAVSESESTTEQNEPLHEENEAETSKRRPKNWKLVAGIAAAGVIVISAVGIVVSVVQPTAIERAGEACSGTKPLDALFDELKATESPEPDPTETRDVDTQKLYGELFDGVVAVEDDGTTLIVSTKPNADDALGMTSLALDCVYEELDVPKHVSELIGSTRALDGRQTGEWDKYSASWGYHPDNGMSLIIAAS
jgi:hypothetical protein